MQTAWQPTYILARQFDAPLDKAQASTETKHLQITTAASNDIARPDLRILLNLDIQLKPSMHVYAPGVQGYIPIDWQLDAGGPVAKRHPFDYPASDRLRLDAINETVPVYRGHIKVQREITFDNAEALKAFVNSSGVLIVRGHSAIRPVTIVNAIFPKMFR